MVGKLIATPAYGRIVLGLLPTALSLVALPATRASADPPPVKGEVTVVLAKEEAGEIDQQLKSITALQKPPFSAFRSMKVLSTVAVVLSDGKPVTTELPNGRRLKLSLIKRMPDGRHKVQVSINKPHEKDYLPVLEVIASGEPFFVAGQKFEGGTLVIGVRVGEPKAAPKTAPKK